VERAQATAEYAALTLLGLLCACALVRFHTPAERLAADLAHLLEHRTIHRVRTAPGHHGHRSGRPRPPNRTCSCPFPAQYRAIPDDSPGQPPAASPPVPP